MSVVGWIVVGLIAGVLAKGVTGVQGTGCLMTMVIGILGGLVGGFLFQQVTGTGIGGFGLRSIVVAFLGACLLLLFFGALSGRRRA
ncbi:MAG: hypothetical protein JWL73_3981 [Actinomycetia bacterium]|nr:hypothetical protein [Actinomycetes bacterium]